MPEVIDWGEKFRQLGQDVSSAITEPVKVRLQMAINKRELDKENYTQEKKNVAADSIGQKYGADAQAFYEAGDFSSYMQMKQLDLKAARGSGGGGRGGGGGGGGSNKFYSQFNLADTMTKELQNQGTAIQQEIAQAQQSGDMAKFEQGMEKFNAWSEAGNKLKMFVGSFTNEGKKATASVLMQNLDDTLKMKTNEQIEAIDKTVVGSIVTSKALSSKVITDLEDLKDGYGLGIDLSGVPSEKAIDTFAIASISNGQMSLKTANEIRNSTDYKKMIAIANDDDQPATVRALAGAKFKKLTAFEAIFPDGKQKLKAATDEQLTKSMFGEDETIEGKRKVDAVTSELKERGRFADDKVEEVSGESVAYKNMPKYGAYKDTVPKEEKIKKIVEGEPGIIFNTPGMRKELAKLKKLESMSKTEKGVSEKIQQTKQRIENLKAQLSKQGLKYNEDADEPL